MEKLFKKAVVAVFAVIAMGVVAYAQQATDLAVGANVAFGFGDNYNNVGIAAKAQSTIFDNIRLEPSITYFFEKDNLSMYDYCLNVHYLINVGDYITVYPLAGIDILNIQENFGYHGTSSHSDLGFIVGGGIDFRITYDVAFNVEAKYRFGDDVNRTLLSAGISYMF